MKKHLLHLFLFVMALTLSHTMVRAAGTVTFANNVMALSTDKCLYAPGDEVTFSYGASLPSASHVRYYHGNTIIADEALSSSSWTWTTPSDDFTGYLAVVYVPQSGNDIQVLATIGIDVSSSWSRFPRYGFVATYDNTKTSSVIASETALQNRWHINGIQYYDWQYLHELPYDKVNYPDQWKDCALRTILGSVVRNYISEHHRYGMKTMFYNLLFGADAGYGDRGVKYEWSLLDGDGNQDYHPLPDGWVGNIYLRDPSNTEWQDFIGARNDDVYEAFDFDGYHIDQLGYRGTRYDVNGNVVDLPQAYKSFINAMKAKRPDKLLVMNGVSNYGGSEIISTGKMEFSYTELWADDDSYQEMERLVREHAAVNNLGTNSVFAAYMNYNRRDEAGGYFNAPGLLLTDAAMFAVGGSHLELGDGHLLCAEYFPNNNLRMSDALKSSMTTYYDFMTAYENLLRDGGTVVDAGVSCTNGVVNVNSWPPAIGRVAAYSRQMEDCKVVSLLNFSSTTDGKHLTCRDVDGDMPEPELKQNIEVSISAPGATKVWMASPDINGGMPQELDFVQNGDNVVLTVPSLKYWTMLVIEQDDAVVLKPAPMVVGAAVFCGWNPQNAAMMVRKENNSNVFTYTGWLKADEEFKFLTQCSWGEPEYRNANTGNSYINGDGEVVLVSGDDNDYKFKVSQSGNYTITLDIDNMTINVVKADYQDNPISYNALYLVGDNTPGGWTLSQATPMKQSADNPFVFTSQLHMTAPEGGSFKIATNPNSTFDDQDFFYRDATYSNKISTDATGDRKWSVEKEDDYLVRVDLQAQTIDIWRAITIGTAGVATYCIDRQLDFTDVEGLKAYIVEGTTGSGEVQGMSYSEVSSAPANQGLLLVGAPGKYFVPTTDRATDNCASNLLVGVTEDTYIYSEADGKKNYILGNGSHGVGFYRSKNGTLGANKAYLSLPSSHNASVLVFEFPEATAVRNVGKYKADDPFYYTLSGVKTSSPVRGIYVKNGKKILVK